MTRFQLNDPLLKERRRDLRKKETDVERILWRALRNKQLDGFKFWRQYSVGPYILDFYCPEKRVAIELDGSQHARPENLSYDEERTKYLVAQDIRVLRFWNNEILSHLNAVLERVLEFVSPPNLPLP